MLLTDDNVGSACFSRNETGIIQISLHYLDLIAIEGLLDSFNFGSTSYQGLHLVFGVQFVDKIEEIATNVARSTGSRDIMREFDQQEDLGHGFQLAMQILAQV
ncbi:unnamed protein product [Clonostachys rhizophaga]|uniref:Uncharacterized protein n=1 Tax=Clonostachys rhizophaga TaxID=160324 RepID=A0A9N9VTY4_9HYPO|nr:unnamed protein product [Clonostachys rhizophaga]